MARFSDENLAIATQIISLYPQSRSALVPLCHLAQSQDGWLTPDAMENIAELLGLQAAEVLGTASFYDMLHTEPVGKYLIGICTNIACMLNGAQEVLEYAEESLGISVGNTTEDNLFTLEETECLADCGKAPCLQVNYRFFGPISNEDFDELITNLKSGSLGSQIPDHGTINRVLRKQGLAVSMSEISSQRAEADKQIAKRKAAQAALDASQKGEGK